MADSVGIEKYISVPDSLVMLWWKMKFTVKFKPLANVDRIAEYISRVPKKEEFEDVVECCRIEESD